jgi:hypothetical protein
MDASCSFLTRSDGVRFAVQHNVTVTLDDDRLFSATCRANQDMIQTANMVSKPNLYIFVSCLPFLVYMVVVVVIFFVSLSLLGSWLFRASHLFIECNAHNVVHLFQAKSHNDVLVSLSGSRSFLYIHLTADNLPSSYPYPYSESIPPAKISTCYFRLS